MILGLSRPLPPSGSSHLALRKCVKSVPIVKNGWHWLLASQWIHRTSTTLADQPPVAPNLLTHSLIRAMLLLMFAFVIPACTPHGNGNLTLKSQSQPGTMLGGAFTSSYYSLDDKNRLTVLLLDGSIEDPAQVVTIRMFWGPRAGRTPIDSTATNATIHYTIFCPAPGQEQEVGVYSGAGFFYPLGKVGGESLTADLWQGTLRLADRSEGFTDLLGQAVLDGHLTATRDEVTVARALRRFETLVTSRLGYPRWLDMQ